MPVAAAIVGALAFAILPVRAQVDGSWAAGSGAWANSANWAGGNIAEGVGATATFAHNTGGAIWPDLGSTPQTVGILNIGPTTSNYTINTSASGTITFDNTGSSPAQINVDAASAAGSRIFINTDGVNNMILEDDLIITQNSPNGFGIQGRFSAAGKTITKEGTGTLSLGGGVTTQMFIGATVVVNAGTLSTAAIHTLQNSSQTIINNGAILNLGFIQNVTGPILVNNGTIDGSAAGSQLWPSGLVEVNTGSLNANVGPTGASDLAKSGAGTFTITKTYAQNGAITVNAGTLIIATTGTVTAATGIAINGGTFQYDNTTTALARPVTINGGTFAYNATDQNYSGALTFTEGTLAGTNWQGNLAGLTIGTDQTISPGNSPGTANTTNQTWAGGGKYIWEINNADNAAGADPGWDLLSDDGTLSITATSGSPFTIEITSLTPTNTSGNVTNFDNLTSYAWLIADAANPISSFASDKFTLDAFAFSNPLGGGTFGIARGDEPGIGGTNQQIFLTFTPIPEPSAALLALLGAAVLGWRSRRRR